MSRKSLVQCWGVICGLRQLSSVSSELFTAASRTSFNLHGTPYRKYVSQCSSAYITPVGRPGLELFFVANFSLWKLGGHLLDPEVRASGGSALTDRASSLGLACSCQLPPMKQPGMTQAASQLTGPGAAFVPLSHPSLQPPFPSVSSSLPSLSYQLHPRNPTHHNSQRTRRRQRRDCRPVALLGRTILFHSVGSASDCGADYSLCLTQTFMIDSFRSHSSSSIQPSAQLCWAHQIQVLLLLFLALQQQSLQVDIKPAPNVSRTYRPESHVVTGLNAAWSEWILGQRDAIKRRRQNPWAPDCAEESRLAELETGATRPTKRTQAQPRHNCRVCMKNLHTPNHLT